MPKVYYYLCNTKYLNDNGYWQERYNFELYKLFKDVNVLKFIKLNRMRWACHLMRMDGLRSLRRGHPAYNPQSRV